MYNNVKTKFKIHTDLNISIYIVDIVFCTFTYYKYVHKTTTGLSTYTQWPRTTYLVVNSNSKQFKYLERKFETSVTTYLALGIALIQVY